MPDFPCNTPPPRKGPGQAHSCPRAGPSSPRGTRHTAPSREGATAGVACTHPARPEWDTPHPLLPLLCTGRCSPLSQGTGSLGFPRPFLRAPLATLVHIFSTPAEHLHQPLAWPSTPPAALSPPSHTPQLAADSLRSYSRSLPHSRTHNGPTAWLIKFKFPCPACGLLPDLAPLHTCHVRSVSILHSPVPPARPARATNQNDTELPGSHYPHPQQGQTSQKYLPWICPGSQQAQ